MLAHPDAIDLPAQQIADGYVYVAEKNGELAGFSAIVPRDDGDFDLDGMFVEPILWKQGIGRRLVDTAALRAAAEGATALHVIGNPRARGFYLSCAFELVGESQTRFGIGLTMRRALM